MSETDKKYVILWEEFLFDVDHPGCLFSFVSKFSKPLIDAIAQATSKVTFIQGPQHGQHRYEGVTLDEDILNVLGVTGAFVSEEEARQFIKDPEAVHLEAFSYRKKRVAQVPQKKGM